MRIKSRDIVYFLDEAQFFCLSLVLFFVPISNAIIEIFAGVALLFFFCKKIAEPDFSFLKSSIPLVLLVFFLFNALSLFNSAPFLNKSLRALFGKWLQYLALFVLVADSLSSQQRLKRILLILLFSAFLIGLDGFFQKIFNFDFLKGNHLRQMQPGVYAVSSSLNHYNSLGSYLCAVLPIVIGFAYFKGLKQAQKIFVFVVLFFLLFCLLFSFSRGAWIGFVLSLLIMAFVSKRKIILSFFLSFLAVVLLIPTLTQRVFFTFIPGGDADRLLLWKTGLKMIGEHPFLGRGVGTFMERLEFYLPQFRGFYAHNSFIQIGAEIGIPGLLSFILFIGLLMTKLFYEFRRTKNFVVLSLLCGLSGFLIHCFFDTDLYSLPLSFLFWYIAGISYGLVVRKIVV